MVVVPVCQVWAGIAVGFRVTVEDRIAVGIEAGVGIGVGTSICAHGSDTSIDVGVDCIREGDSLKGGVTFRKCGASVIDHGKSVGITQDIPWAITSRTRDRSNVPR